MHDVWDENWWGSTKTLDVHVASLRKKLEPDLIETVRAQSGSGSCRHPERRRMTRRLLASYLLDHRAWSSCCWRCRSPCSTPNASASGSPPTSSTTPA